MMAVIGEKQRIDTKTVLAVFEPTVNFERIFQELNTLGYPEEAVTVLMSESTCKEYFYDEKSEQVVTHLEDKAPEGFTTGAIAGGALGAVIGGITLAGTLFIPGSQILLLGPAVGALAGAAGGAAAGGLIGALIGMGIPEVEAKFYKQAVEEGGNVLVAVNTVKSEARDIEKVLKQYHPKSISVAS